MMYRATDHDAADALGALSVPTEATPGGVSRRRFLTGLGAAGVLGTVAGSSLLRPRAAFGQAADRNLAVFYLMGGNDGFATVMPTGASPLDQLRPKLLVNKSTLRSIGDGYGLHPSLATLHSRYTADQVAIVGGVGGSGSLSHFDALADWMTGAPGANRGAAANTGWVGRWLDTLGPGLDTPLRAVSFTGQVPQLLVGRTTGGVGLGTARGALLGSSRRNVVETGLFSAIDGWAADADSTTARGHAAAVAATSTELARNLGDVYSPAPPPEGPVAQATLAARLLNDPSYGCRTVFCNISSFDHHTDLLNAQAKVLAVLDRALAAFFASLAPGVADRTTALVFSEFGRRAAANGSAGTDHGTASYAFLVGPQVNGGVYGAHLDAAGRDSGGNPPTTVPHLDLVGSVVSWLGADPSEIVGAPTSPLGIFR
jgi:uncharacterized protein (DUF1501 family)